MAIRFSCPKCAKPFSAPVDLAGLSVECEACSASITVPESSEPEPVIEAKLVQDGEPEVITAALVEAPPRRRKKRSVLKILFVLTLLGMFFAILLGVGGGAYWYFALRDRGLAGDLDYMPDGFTSLHALNFDEVKAGPAFEKAKACPGNKERYSFTKTPGGKTLDVTRAMIGQTTYEKITVLMVRNDVTIQDLVDANVRTTESKIAGKKVYDTEKTTYVIDGKRVIIGSNAGVRAVLERRGAPKLTDTIRDAMKVVDFSRPEITVLDESQSGRGFVEFLQAIGHDIPVALVVENDYQLPMNVHTKLVCRDEKSAETVQADQLREAPGQVKRIEISEVKRKEKLVTVVGRVNDPCKAFERPEIEP